MRLGGGGVKGPRSNNMPRAPRNVNPALMSVLMRGILISTLIQAYMCVLMRGILISTLIQAYMSVFMRGILISTLIQDHGLKIVFLKSTVHKLSVDASFVHHYAERGDKKQFFPAV